MPLLVLMGIARRSETRVGAEVGESKAKVPQMPLLVPRDLVKITDGESNKGDPGITAPSRLAVLVARVKDDPLVLEFEHVSHGAIMTLVGARGGAVW